MSSEAAGLVKFSEVVEALRLELGALAKEAEKNNEGLRFEVLGAEVELQVVITDGREAGGGGKVGFNIGVVQVGVDGAAKMQHAEARTHKVKLSLKPLTIRADGSNGVVHAHGVKDPGYQVPSK